jgi:hypothetical protein
VVITEPDTVQTFVTLRSPSYDNAWKHTYTDADTSTGINLTSNINAERHSGLMGIELGNGEPIPQPQDPNSMQFLQHGVSAQSYAAVGVQFQPPKKAGILTISSSPAWNLEAWNTLCLEASAEIRLTLGIVVNGYGATSFNVVKTRHEIFGIDTRGSCSGRAGTWKNYTLSEFCPAFSEYKYWIWVWMTAMVVTCDWYYYPAIPPMVNSHPARQARTTGSFAKIKCNAFVPSIKLQFEG